MSNLTEQQIIDLFKDAPEGAEFYQPDCDDYIESWLKDVEYNSYSIMLHNEKEWTYCDYASDAERDGKLIPRPEVKPVAVPVYTQEMCDDGTLPQVGELVQIRMDHNDDDNFYNGQLVHESKGVVWIVDDRYGSCLHSRNTVSFKPLTPPVVLKDGKAYQFDYNGRTELIGIYHKSDDTFGQYTVTSSAKAATNIQLLGVKS